MIDSASSRAGEQSRSRSPSPLVFKEDNQATIRIIETGKSGAIRHVGRTHRVDIAWLNEVLRCGHLVVDYIETTLQAADIFTKAFTNLDRWVKACLLTVILVTSRSRL